mmetsp:Transcript_58932/g.138575  ORF Transcript_58932/g.138575 Transcript_58932/m.138575 type:complete len:226 (+) Transcript_58932:51-728(+)
MAHTHGIGIPALSVANQQTRDALQGFNILSQGIAAGTPFNEEDVEKSEKEKHVLRFLRELDPNLVSQSEVIGSEVRNHAVKSAHSTHQYSGSGAPAWAQQMMQTMSSLQNSVVALQASVNELKTGQNELKNELKNELRALHAKISNARVTRGTERLVPVPSMQAAPGTPIPNSFPQTWQAFMNLSQNSCAEIEAYSGLQVGGGGEGQASVGRRNALAQCIGVPLL